VSEDARLALVRELERADAEVAAVLSELDELYAAVEAVGARAVQLEAFLTELPVERAAATAAVEETARALREAEETAGAAAAQLQEAEAGGTAERIATARRFAVRAQDAASTAARLAAEADAAASRLEKRAEAAEEESSALQTRARELAVALGGRARLAADVGSGPAAGLEGVSEWAGKARAALLVARTALSAERDTVIRQANELAALVLGEPLGAAGTAVVARRLERKLGH
jgi:hypothetical protein